MSLPPNDSTNMPSEVDRVETDGETGDRVVFVNGLRHVSPYFADLRTRVKRRWVGQPLLTVLEHEFVEDSGYFSVALESGRVVVHAITNATDSCDSIAKDERTSPHLRLLDRHCIHHRLHRHEKQVLDIAPVVVARREDYIVVAKPPSIPVHACGRFQKNCLLYMLSREWPRLYTVNRLDRLTSGLVVLATSSTAAERLNRALRERTVSKSYYARVHGHFSGSCVRISKRMVVLNARDGVHGCTDDPSQGVDACTEVSKVRYFPKLNQTVVLCHPLTGRTHQIRVHLQSIGHPIVNDFDYGACTSSLPKSVSDRMSADEEEKRPAKRARNEAFDSAVVSDECRAFMSPPLPAGECSECEKRLVVSDPRRLFICLHAWKYEIEGQVYETEPPGWVTDEDPFTWLDSATRSKIIEKNEVVEAAVVVEGNDDRDGLGDSCQE